MEKSLLPKVRQLLYALIILKEWIDNGEFTKADKILVIGTRLQAFMVNYLFYKKNKKVYYIVGLDMQCKCGEYVKWIVFDNKFKKVLSRDDYNILFIPYV